MRHCYYRRAPSTSGVCRGTLTLRNTKGGVSHIRSSSHKILYPNFLLATLVSIFQPQINTAHMRVQLWASGKVLTTIFCPPKYIEHGVYGDLVMILVKFIFYLLKGDYRLLEYTPQRKSAAKKLWHSVEMRHES